MKNDYFFRNPRTEEVWRVEGRMCELERNKSVIIIKAGLGVGKFVLSWSRES